MSSQKPIVREQRRACNGRCGRRVTPHRLVVYQDSDNWTCLVCGHKETIRYDRHQRDTGVTGEQVRRARNNLNNVIGDMQTRRWGNMGKKDKSFIQRVIDRLIGIGRDLDIE